MYHLNIFEQLIYLISWLFFIILPVMQQCRKVFMTQLSLKYETEKLEYEREKKMSFPLGSHA